MTIFAYNHSLNGAASVTVLQASAASYATEKSGDGVEFLDPSDATAGVHFDLPPSVATLAAGSVVTDALQSFETLILVAFADLIDTRVLADIR
ncbi:MAG: hypothetical protein AB7O88_26350 [Reyranellaceae bacterium]